MKLLPKSDEKLIKSDYVKYNKKLGYLLIKDNILFTDDKDNSIQYQMPNIIKKVKY